ncbi:hypothetical protein LINPERPRIM_LOCUS24529 [Linum perenne]
MMNSRSSVPGLVRNFRT